MNTLRISDTGTEGKNCCFKIACWNLLFALYCSSVDRVIFMVQSHIIRQNYMIMDKDYFFQGPLVVKKGPLGHRLLWKNLK